MKSGKTSSISYVLTPSFSNQDSHLHDILQEDEAVLLERKMKAEEEDVDIDTIAIATSPPSNGPAFSGFNASKAGTPAPNGDSSSHPKPDPVGSGEGVAGGGRSDSPGDMAMHVDLSVDPDALWAEEDPDDDLPGAWRMKVLMEDDDDS